jgi:hypothetical protein
MTGLIGVILRWVGIEKCLQGVEPLVPELLVETQPGGRGGQLRVTVMSRYVGTLHPGIPAHIMIGGT